MSFLGAALGGFGGSVVGGAVVQLLLDDKQFQAAMGRAKGQTATAAGGFSKFAGVASAAFATIGFAAVAGIGTAVSAAIEAEEAELKLANSIENSAKVSKSAEKAFIKQADALRDLTGVDDEAIIGAQAFLVQMGLTEKQITKLTPLVVDLSVKMGVDLETAAKAVGKSVNGTTGGLQRMGVVVDKTRAQTDAYGATLDALGVAQGFAAEQAENQPWVKLTAQFEELAEQVGKALLPAVKLLSESLEDAMPLIELVGKGLEDFSVSSDNSAISLTHLASKFNLLPEPVKVALDIFDAYKGKTEALDRAQMELAADLLNELGPAFIKAGNDLADGFLPYLFDVQESAPRAGRGVRRFANLSANAIGDLRKKAKEDVAAMLDSVDGFERKWKFTAGEFRRTINGMRVKSGELRGDLRELATMKAVPEPFQAWLLQQGPDAIHAFVENSKQGRNAIVEDWKALNSNTDANKRAIDKVTTALGDVKAAVNDLPRRKTIDIELNIHTNVSGPGASALSDELAGDLIRSQL